MINEFIYPLRVYIEDTDYGGVVYHANYLKFLERARTEWAEKLGMGLAWQNQHKIYFVVHKAYIEYLKPARLYDELEVISHIKALRPASIIYEQHLRLAGVTDKILTKAETKITCVDHTINVCKIPEAKHLRQRFGGS